MDRVDDSTGSADANTLSDTVTTSSPSSVHKPNVDVVLLNLLIEQIGIGLGLEWEESLTEASGEGRSRFFNSLLSSCNFGCVS